MATIVDGPYEDFRQQTFQSVYYVDPASGRTDTWDMYGMLPGGAVFRCQVAEKPETFDADYPDATKVAMMSIT
ncbi:MAG TPA: hypothetical protein VFX80_02375 [Solirubrobacteraceae bacterium]|nr:hypothetical protein [Solirubrobacteraceae bacterium]